MKVVVALDSFKGSCTAHNACEAVATGFKKALHDSEILCCPISDGGEGLIDSLYGVLQEQGFVKHHHTVLGPYQGQVKASFLYNEQQGEAIVEMAQCSGIELNLNHPREGEKATTYGLGQLIGHILSLKCRTIKIGLGGSATNDAGAGFAQALGAKFYDSHDQLITEPLCGSMLSKIARVDTSELDAALKDVEIFGTCDVTNPLTGSNGATYTFGPQKGIKVQNLATLDEAMQSFADLMNAHYKRSVDTVAGAGAAGGMGAALLWFAHGTLERGIDIVMRTLKLEEKIKDSSLVIVGEGRIDGQSLQGKAPLGVAKLAKEHKIPVIALCGSIGANAEALYEHGINAIYSLCNGPMTLDEAMSNAEELIEKLSYNIARTVSLSLN